MEDGAKVKKLSEIKPPLQIEQIGILWLKPQSKYPVLQ